MAKLTISPSKNEVYILEGDETSVKRNIKMREGR